MFKALKGPGLAGNAGVWRTATRPPERQGQSGKGMDMLYDMLPPGACGTPRCAGG